ncbi:hypothetical protein JCM10213v2_007398 [Rhodosporidiobolus nylandii]
MEQLEAALDGPLSDATYRTKDELRRLAQYRAPPAPMDYPKKRLAAVLVLLHLNPRGELSVTLTTRSMRLRSHPGETALPGGRWEEGDGEGGEWTALREASEEIALPLPSSSSTPHMLYLCTLSAFTSRTLLVVLPVVYLLLHPALSASTFLEQTLRPNPDEVDSIFHLPLRSFLMLDDEGEEVGGKAASSPIPLDADEAAVFCTDAAPLPPAPASPAAERPAPGTETLTHSFTDFTWLLDLPYRLHRFSHPFPGVTPSAVTGLTADIVLEVALLASYGPSELGAEQELKEGRIGFERHAPGQMRWSEIVQEAMRMQGEKGLAGLVSRDAEGEEGQERPSET